MEPSELTREGDEKASPIVPTSDASDLEDATEGTAFLLKPIPTQHPIRRVGSGRIGSVNIALLCFNLMLSAVVVMSWMGNGGETADQYHFAYDHGESCPQSTLDLLRPVCRMHESPMLT
jgi:hypothetical protein